MKKMLFFAKRKKAIRSILILLIAVILLCVLSALVINVSVVAKTQSSIFEFPISDEDNGKYDCILILGAGVRSDGTPSPMLEDRLKAGKYAYDLGAAPLIVVSGDSHKDGYDEVLTMKKYLVENGVPEECIICDGYGLSTYDSIYRLAYVYGYKNTLIVSQSYHLNRAVYIADKLGLDACGLSADFRNYRSQLIYSSRECAARVKDFFFTLKPASPKYAEVWTEN